MKINFLLLVISLSLVLVPKIKAWDEQNLYLFNNYLYYGEWREKELSSSDYQVQINKNGQIYKTYENFTHSNFKQNQDKWPGVNIFFENEEIDWPSVIRLSSQKPASFITHQLEESEIDFAFLSFKYKISNIGTSEPNRPLARLSLCGQPDWLVIESKEKNSKDGGYFLSNHGIWEKVLLPNPGTCKNNREVKIEMLEAQNGEMPEMIRLSNFSLNDWKFSSTRQTTVQSMTDQLLISLSDEEVLEKGERITIASNDWYRQNFKIASWKDDDITATKHLSYMLASPSLYYAGLMIDNLKWENDQSLTLEAKFNTRERKIQMSLAYVSKIEDFYKSWDELPKIGNDFLPNYQEISHITFAEEKQIIHFPKVEELDHEKGFYLAVRAQGRDETWSELSNIFWCKKNICEKVVLEEKDHLEIIQIFIGNNPQDSYVDIWNPNSVKSITANDYILTDDVEIGQKINDYWKRLEVKRVYLNEVELNWNTGGKLKIYDQNGVIQDEISYPPLGKSMLWTKNRNNQKWEGIYERS